MHMALYFPQGASHGRLGRNLVRLGSSMLRFDGVGGSTGQKAAAHWAVRGALGGSFEKVTLGLDLEG
jgi:hypothetical protein